MTDIWSDHEYVRWRWFPLALVAFCGPAVAYGIVAIATVLLSPSEDTWANLSAAAIFVATLLVLSNFLLSLLRIVLIELPHAPWSISKREGELIFLDYIGREKSYAKSDIASLEPYMIKLRWWLLSFLHSSRPTLRLTFRNGDWWLIRGDSMNDDLERTFGRTSSDA